MACNVIVEAIALESNDLRESGALVRLWEVWVGNGHGEARADATVVDWLREGRVSRVMVWVRVGGDYRMVATYL